MLRRASADRSKPIGLKHLQTHKSLKNNTPGGVSNVGYGPPLPSHMAALGRCERKPDIPILAKLGRVPARLPR